MMFRSGFQEFRVWVLVGGACMLALFWTPVPAMAPAVAAILRVMWQYATMR